MLLRLNSHIPAKSCTRPPKNSAKPTVTYSVLISVHLVFAPCKEEQRLNHQAGHRGVVCTLKAHKDALQPGTRTEMQKRDSDLKQGSRISESNQPKSAWICGCSSRTGLGDDAVIPVVHRLRPAVVFHVIATVALNIFRISSTVEDSGRRHVLDVGHADHEGSTAVQRADNLCCSATAEGRGELRSIFQLQRSHYKALSVGTSAWTSKVTAISFSRDTWLPPCPGTVSWD